MQKVAAIVVVVGSILFLAAAFSPVSRVFGVRDVDERLAILSAAPTQWQVSQVGFGLGAVVTALGIALLAPAFRGPITGLLAGAAALLLVGAGFWVWHVWLRAADPPAFVRGDLPHWNFVVYSLLSQVGFALAGVALLRAGLPAWVGWMLIGGMGLFLVLMVVFRDMPPFVYYVLTLIAGVVVYRTG
jgi:hypothetical protein